MSNWSNWKSHFYGISPQKSKESKFTFQKGGVCFYFPHIQSIFVPLIWRLSFLSKETQAYRIRSCIHFNTYEYSLEYIVAHTRLLISCAWYSFLPKSSDGAVPILTFGNTTRHFNQNFLIKIAILRDIFDSEHQRTILIRNQNKRCWQTCLINQSLTLLWKVGYSFWVRLLCWIWFMDIG